MAEELIEDPKLLYQKVTADLSGTQQSAAELGTVRARTAAALHSSGLTYEQIGKQLGLSVSRISQLVGSNPPEIVEFFRAWSAVEAGLRRAGERLGLSQATARVTGKVIDLLSERGALDKSQIQELRRFRDLRNATLHGRRDIGEEEANRAGDSAIHLVASLELLPDHEIERVEETRTCFVIGPIGDRHASPGSPERARFEQSLRIWEKVIKPACEAVALEPLRADSIAKAGEITDQVFRYLRDADVVIADVTGGNPNVMYELGIRHTLDKLTIQLGEASRLPFDIQAIRTIRYVANELGYIEAREELTQVLLTGLDSGFDQVSATRVWNEGLSLSEQPEVTEELEPPGFLDQLAEAEEAMPGIAESMAVATEAINKIGSLANQATEEMTASNARGGASVAKLVIARRLASDLAAPVAEIQQAAASYSEIMSRIDPGMSYMIDRIEEEPALLSEAGEFPDSLEQLAEVTRESMSSTQSLIDSAQTWGPISKDLRAPSKKISQALESIIESSSPILKWGERVRRVREEKVL